MGGAEYAGQFISEREAGRDTGGGRENDVIT
jgi:hypothetical protein